MKTPEQRELVGRIATAAGEPCPHVRFEVGDNGIMLDTKTDLEWLAGPDERSVRDDAVAWVDGLEEAGLENGGDKGTRFFSLRDPRSIRWMICPFN